MECGPSRITILKNQKLILSRDRFARSHYFFKNNKSFLFGSCLNYIKSLSHENFKINFKKLKII